MERIDPLHSTHPCSSLRAVCAFANLIGVTVKNKLAFQRRANHIH